MWAGRRPLWRGSKTGPASCPGEAESHGVLTVEVRQIRVKRDMNGGIFLHMKKVLALVLAAVMAVGLTACGVNITQMSLPETMEVKVGETIDAVATFTAEDESADAEKLAAAAEKLDLVWSTSDEAVATVDENGVITGVSGGEVNITVATKDGKMSASTTVKVLIPAADFELEDIVLTTIDKDIEPELVLLPEGSVADAIEYVSADEAVLAVIDGKLTAVAAGETELQVSVDGVEKSIKVTVQQAPVELSGEDVHVQIGKTAKMAIATGFEGNVEVGTEFTYKSNDEAVATVDENGVITGVEVGETTITVENELGQTCEVRVIVEKTSSGRPSGTATGNVSGGNGGSTGTAGGGTNTQTQPSGGGTAPTQPSTPDPAPQPSNPDPAPQPPADNGVVSGGGAGVGQDGNLIIGGGGVDQGDGGGNATPNEPPAPSEGF